MPEPRPLPYGRQSVDADDIQAVARVLASDWLTTGPRVAEFEAALAQVGGARHAVAVNSGTAALHCAYVAAGLGPGDEIVTSPLTFVATAAAAMHTGASVRFADVEPDTGNLDPARAAEALGPRTRAVVAIDYAGHPADYSALRELTGRPGIALIADAAHSLGARAHGRPVGALADATATSFHPVKAITTAEGGALLTDDDLLRDRAVAFRSHGIVRDRERLCGTGGAWYYEVQSLGLNYRLPDVLCALGLSQLGKLERFLARRREIARRYDGAFAGVAGLELPAVRAGIEPAWHLYVLRVRDARAREPLFDELRRRGLGVQLHYHPVHLHPIFADLGLRDGLCPIAEDFARRALSIPLYPALTDSDVERVIETVLGASAELL